MEATTKLSMQDPEFLALKAKILVKKKVALMPVTREGQMVSDPTNKSFFQYEGTKVRFCLSIDPQRRALVPILNDEERMFFETLLGEDLNFYKKKDSFWHKFEVLVVKDEQFMKNGYVLDLSNPIDNLKERVLRTSNIVAPSWEQKYDDPGYRYALRDEGYVEEKQARKADLMKKAYKLLSKIDTSSTKMFNFLSVYFMEANKAKRPPEGADNDTYKGLIQEIIDEQPSLFVSILSDDNYDMKLLVIKALGIGAITRKSASSDFESADGKYLGRTITDVVKNLGSADLNEYLLRIQAQVDASEN